MVPGEGEPSYLDLVQVRTLPPPNDVEGRWDPGEAKFEINLDPTEQKSTRLKDTYKDARTTTIGSQTITYVVKRPGDPGFDEAGFDGSPEIFAVAQVYRGSASLSVLLLAGRDPADRDSEKLFWEFLDSFKLT